MTTNTITPEIEYIEDGVTTTHPIPYKFLADTDLVVQRIAADGSVTLLSLGVDYAATGAGDDEGGTLVKSSGGTSGARIRIRRFTARSQGFDYTPNDTFPAESHETALDRQSLINQEQDVQIDALTLRAIQAPDGEEFSILPAAGTRKGKLLGFDAASGDVELQDFLVTTLDGSTVSTRAALSAIAGPVAGQVAVLTAAGYGGYFVFDDSDLSTEVTADTELGIYIAPSTDLTGASGAWVRRYDGPLRVSWFNAVGDGSTDDTDSLIAAINMLDDGDTLDLQGYHLNIFVGVVGVTSGDAVTIGSVPRLFGKNNVTIRNGKITADSPGVSGTKYRYPTSLTIDGCTNVRLENLVVHSKGESYGDTDASVGEGAEDRREFAAQNGGHAILVVRSLGTSLVNCHARLCGSVGSIYVISSHDTKLHRCFSNPGSLGYAAYAFDSWCGNASVSGFAAHCSTMTDCSAYKEGYPYGSKGCVLTEDKDVSVTVNGGFFADAYPNGTARDLGYAFGCSSSQTIVNGAVVENCASIGYTATTNGTDESYLYIANVHAIGLRKTVHQTENTSVGTMRWLYVDVIADVVGGGTWAGDGNLAREETSYVAIMNLSNTIYGKFSNCQFTGATYGFINATTTYGHLQFRGCSIETNGFLADTKNIGSGSAGRGLIRGIHFFDCDIEDISSETTAYFTVFSTIVYTYIDLSTSTIRLNSARNVESSTISTPGTFIDKYSFPRPEVQAVTLSSVSIQLDLQIGKVVRADNTSGGALALALPRADKYKFLSGHITNVGGANDIRVETDAFGATLVTLTPGQTCAWFTDGTSYRAFVL